MERCCFLPFRSLYVHACLSVACTIQICVCACIRLSGRYAHSICASRTLTCHVGADTGTLVLVIVQQVFGFGLALIFTVRVFLVCSTCIPFHAALMDATSVTFWFHRIDLAPVALDLFSFPFSSKAKDFQQSTHQILLFH